MAALKAATDKNTAKKSKTLLLSFMDTAKAVNERELIGLIRHMTHVRTAGAGNKKLWESFMEMLVRQGWAASGEYDEQLSILHDKFDEMLVDTWSLFNHEALFFRRHRNSTALLEFGD